MHVVQEGKVIPQESLSERIIEQILPPVWEEFVESEPPERVSTGLLEQQADDFLVPHRGRKTRRSHRKRSSRPGAPQPLRNVSATTRRMFHFVHGALFVSRQRVLKTHAVMRSIRIDYKSFGQSGEHDAL